MLWIYENLINLHIFWELRIQSARSGTINIGNVFSHITLKKCVCNFPYVVCFFYNLLKFDTVNADVPFYKKGHKFETEAKLQTKPDTLFQTR